ncbi:MAG: prepilin-type N-terminal cleavage/methylation domain-containing protein, partial [Opitutus sp.]
TTPSRARKAFGLASRPAASGFTLVEVMVGAALSSFILAGILSTFLFLGRTGANVANYTEMEGQARRGLELFAEDVRQASAITWNSNVSVTLVVNGTPIVYQYDSSITTFQRRDPGTTRNLLTGITTFQFKGYNINGAEVDMTDLVAASKITKQLQISLRASRTSQTVASATNTVLSARFILRNKRITT